MTGRLEALHVPGYREVPNQPDDERQVDVDDAPIYFRRWSMAELLAEPEDFAWLIQGMLADPTYGQIAGEMKSLKTYLAAMIQVGLAAGVPILGRFKPDRPRPVIAYVGEGGRKPYIRRLRRIASAMDVRLSDIHLEIVTDVAPIHSDIFTRSLERDLAEVQPGLVFIDPLYAYHGVKVSASNLHEEGALLTSLSNRCLNAGASILIVNHMNQTGSGMDLKRITMAGSGEWVDTWMLLKHREAPQVEAGDFKLRVEIGSRQWGGTSWDLDLSIGRFDEDRGSHDGHISWELQRSNTSSDPNSSRGTRNEQKAADTILETLADEPWRLTKTQIRTIVAGNREAFDNAFNTLIDKGLIAHNKSRRTEGDTLRTRPVWGIARNPDQPTGPGSTGEDE